MKHFHNFLGRVIIGDRKGLEQFQFKLHFLVQSYIHSMSDKLVSIQEAAEFLGGRAASTAALGVRGQASSR
ncbi:hypothetical protein A7Q09_06800 [Methylacidiphilum sp. Yel]|nr:hypothetical protein A7Q09_06800 [Methylacidiphilum sp. Yel]